MKTVPEGSTKGHKKDVEKMLGAKAERQADCCKYFGGITKF